MAIRIGAVDPDYYQRQQESQRRSLYGLMEAMNAYEEKRRKRAEHELQAGLQTPGWVDSEMGRDWYSKRGQEYPELARYFDAEKSKGQIRNEFFGRFGASGNLRSAFSQTPPEQMGFVLDEAKAWGMKPESLFPDTLEYDEVPREFAPLWAMEQGVFGPGADITPEQLQAAALVGADMVASPREIQQKAHAEELMRTRGIELENLKHGNQMAEIAARKPQADVQSATTSLNREKFSRESLKAEVMGLLAPTVPPETTDRDESRIGADRYTVQTRDHERWADAATSKLTKIAQFGGQIDLGDLQRRLQAEVEVNKVKPEEAKKKLLSALDAEIRRLMSERSNGGK